MKKLNINEMIEELSELEHQEYCPCSKCEEVNILDVQVLLTRLTCSFIIPPLN